MCLGRRAHHFSFAVGGKRYHMGCAFVIAADEARVTVTHIFRVAL